MKSFHKRVEQMRREMKVLPNLKRARLDFLIKWSDVRCQPHKGLSTQERRVRFQRMNRSRKLASANCWVCVRQTMLVRHHVIQLQFGGGNVHYNIVTICEGCHAEVHPWLDAEKHPLVEEVKQWDDTVPF